MDDPRSTLTDFDPDAPLPGMPDPWAYMPTPTERPGPPWAMAEMIAAEPGLADRIADRVRADGSAEALASLLRAAAAEGSPVVATGCGTSEHAAMATAAVLRDAWRAAGLPGRGPVAAQAFELALDPPAGGVVIGISHEGGTTATMAAMAAGRTGGASVALITGSAASPAAAGSDVTLATVEMDRGWCHTVGYLSPIVAASVVGSALAGTSPGAGALGARVRQGIESAHAAGPDGARPDETIGATIAAATHLLVIGTGADRITARELALKVEEAAWVPSAVRDLETFLHGHLPATGPETAVLLVLSERAGLAARAKRARQALAAAASLGMRPAAILGADAAAAIPESLTPGGRIVIPESPDLPPAVASLLGGAGPLQLVTLAVSAARGTNPDLIRREDARYYRAAELADDPNG
ncbi:MAG TPA: SIS domain-containing protein [Candidatus Limnocylindrales bacterium]|jgi:fructoselysine-6-P-deglycase FrlB-like protein